MKKLFAVAGLCLMVFFAMAQDEELTNLNYNPTVYRANKKHLPGNQHRYLIDKGIIVVNSTTLSLPFVDDFTTNSLPTVNYRQQHITNTFYNVYGTCLAVEGVPLILGEFMNDSSYTYSYNTITHTVDSTGQLPHSFTFFGPAPSGCFTQTPQTMQYWDAYYRYTFDSLGNKLDSVKVTPDETIYYAPVIYFADEEPGKLWFDNYAYINNTYPINPPTIGVATLDGLNEYGLPYNNSTNQTYGTADYLTSKPINLLGLDTDKVFLSFFYEGRGLGDYPDKNDSLFVEFRDIGGIWRTVWSDTGYASIGMAPQKFSQVLIPIPDAPLSSTYFHSVFQFRFRNKASLYGNNDHWHLDYVKLDKNRSAADTIIRDIAFVYPLPTMLKNFTLMPADQFIYPTDLRDSIIVSVHNLDPNANNNPPATDFTKAVEQVYPTQAIVLNTVQQTFNAADYSYIELDPALEYMIPNTPNWPVDSLVLNTLVTIDPADTRAANDTLRHTQHFDNTYAYDDGSAELSYGLTGTPGIKKFAYEFTLNQPDTLVGFQVQFSQVEENVSDLVFNFNAWDSLSLNNFLFVDDSTLTLTVDNKKPLYVDSVNGFTTYKLETPLLVDRKIYFGWTQTDSRRLQVGYDVNSPLGKPHMYIYANGRWTTSSINIPGSPMIRLIFDSNYWGGSTAVDNLKEENKLRIYPNPTTGIITINSRFSDVTFEATVLNMLGESVLTENNVVNRLDISGLNTGIYILNLRDVNSGKSFQHKIIKTGL
ncbi:MAG TPA: T9SS type A sorting domain-containing protein [Chitinophagales bacterium]|nr:T9SS type A sorting domain-containing protein [Chitinophagales bacterium]